MTPAQVIEFSRYKSTPPIDANQQYRFSSSYDLQPNLSAQPKCPPVYPKFCLPVCRPVCPTYLSACLPDIPVCLPDISVCLSARHTCLSVCLPDRPVCMPDISVCLSARHICLSVCPTLFARPICLNSLPTYLPTHLPNLSVHLARYLLICLPDKYPRNSSSLLRLYT